MQLQRNLNYTTRNYYKPADVSVNKKPFSLFISLIIV